MLSSFPRTLLVQLVRVVIVFSLPAIAVGQSTLIDWDFETAFPSYSYSDGYAGQGLADCLTNIENTGQVSAEHNVTSPAAQSRLNTSGWNIQADACWTYTGWEFGLGHLLGGQRLTSSDLSQYRLSFDAWVEGTDELPAIVQLHLQDNSAFDDGGNPITRVVFGNNRTVNDGDQNPFMLDSQRQRFSVTMDNLGFADFDNNGTADFSQADFNNHFAAISSINVEIEPQGTSGILPAETNDVIGVDNNNVFYLDNVRLDAPFMTAHPVQTMLSWDFEATRPSYSYANAYAGQGTPDCSDSINNSNQVSVEFDANGITRLDTSNWNVAGDACFSFAGVEYGLGHILDGSQQLASSDLSQYRLSFEAWVEGSDELEAVVQLHLQDNSLLDADNNPVTRVVIGNNRALDDGDQNPLVVSSERKSFSMTLADLGFSDLNNDGVDDFTQSDLNQFFASITSINIEIEPQGTSGSVASETMNSLGFDNNNVFRLANVQLDAPLILIESNCDPNSGGDLDGNGQVAFADFLVLSRNFGNQVDSHRSGDIDCNGSVQFADFLVLSRNFGKTVGAQNVPEPDGFSLIGVAGLLLLIVRRRSIREI